MFHFDAHQCIGSQGNPQPRAPWAQRWGKGGMNGLGNVLREGETFPRGAWVNSMHSLRTMSTVVSEEPCEYLGSNGVAYLPSDCDSLLADENIINRKSTQKNKPVTIVSLLFSYTTWRKSVLNIHCKDWCWNWNSNTLATWCKKLTHLKRPWCWERLKAGREGDDREWDGWMASPTQWTWVWVNSRRWWWKGGLECCSPWGCKELGRTERLNWLNYCICFLFLFTYLKQHNF